MSNQQYLNSIKPGAIAGWHKYKIAPSITGAQAALESGWGSSKLAKPPYNNNFGIKASPDWTGRKITMSTQEYVNGRWITINDDFRTYDTLSDSIADHSAFFTNTEWRKNNYREVVGQIDYKKAANALRKAGYATDPGYPQKLINIIEQYNLQSWDQEALRGETTNTVTPPTIPTSTGTKKKVVGGSISSSARNGISQFTLSVIGDSLGVGTEPFLKQYPWAGQSYDNYGSRQWTHGTDIYNGITALNNMKNAGNLNNNVVFILGTNRGVDASEIDEAVSICGRDRNLILVDTTSEVNHRTKVSAEYEKAASRHDNVFYANWSSYSRASIGSWYYADGANGTRIHMNPTGYQKHADFIVQAVYEANQMVFDKSITVDPIKSSTEGVNIYDIEYDDGVFTSPKGDSSIYNKTLNDQLGFRARKGQIMWIERKYSGSETDSASLLDAAIEKMKEASVPAAQYTVSMRYFPDTISIGDTGIFVDHEFDPPLYIQARVLEITTSDSNPSGNTVTIGNVVEVTPQAKSDLLSIQQELQDTRDMSLAEYWKEKPVTLQVTTSNGLILKPQESEIFAQLVKRSQSEHVVKDGSVLVDMYKAKSTDATITVTGSIKDNYIDSIDEIVDNINYDEYDDVNFDDGPIDVDSNPQGQDVVDINDYNNIRKLIVDQFDVELLDVNDQVIGTEKVYVYEDSTFIFKIVKPMRQINKIRILSPRDCTFDNISAIDESVNLIDTIDSTRVYVKAFQEEKEVTHEFKNFKWTRVSQNTTLDEEWNDINKWNESNGIDLDVKDVYGSESTFICRMYDDEYNFVSSIGVTLSISTNGKSAYDLAVEAGFEGTLDEWVESLRGSDGVNGTEGPKGEDGQNTYIHVAWAHSPLGDGFSTSDSTDKLYMGTYVDEIEADSEDYSDYKWTRIKGDDGDPSYFHRAWMDDEDGTGFITEDDISDIKETLNKKFIGTYSSFDPVPSRDYSDYKWQRTAEDYAKEFEDVIGSEGEITYNKNRLLGPVERIIKENESTLIEHNGKGYEIGKVYTISMDVECVAADVITWEDRSRTEVISFVRETQYDPDLYPNQSRISRNGVNGSATYIWKVELVNGELTGNKTEEVRSDYQAPINEIFIQGTKDSSDVILNFTADEIVKPTPVTKSDVIINLIEPSGSLQPDPVDPIEPVEPVEPGESQFTNARVVNLADYGGSSSNTDNFNAFQQVVTDSVNEPLVLEIDSGVYDLRGADNQRLEPWPAKSKGLRIVGKGDVVIRHKNNRTNQRHEYYFMQMVMTDDSLGFEAENFTLDGIRNPQEELFYTQSESNPITNVPMARGISIDGAHHVNFNNVRFKNMYGGYAIQLQEYRDVNITNTTYDKVGGNDIQESFGMAIYLGGHSGNAIVNIDNAQAQGMVTHKDLRLSWIGVVLENGSIQSKSSSAWLRDKNTTVNITNSSFLDYHSTFHTESMAGNVYWNVDNLKARGSNYNIVAGVYGEFKEVSNRVTMDVLPYGRLWGIVKGLYYSEPQEKEDNWSGHNKLEMYNSVINFIKVAGFEDPPQAIAYGNNVMGRLYNTQLNNVPNRLVTNGSALLYNSEINLAQGNNATRATLMAGEFSDPSKQKVEFTNTRVNPYGSHKNVTFGTKPAEAKNTGFVAPWIELPIQPPI